MLKIDSVFSGQQIKRGANLQRVRYKAVKEAIFYRLFFRQNDDNLLVVARLSKIHIISYSNRLFQRNRLISWIIRVSSRLKITMVVIGK
jgi:hypothetical protein